MCVIYIYVYIYNYRTCACRPNAFSLTNIAQIDIPASYQLAMPLKLCRSARSAVVVQGSRLVIIRITVSRLSNDLW